MVNRFGVALSFALLAMASCGGDGDGKYVPDGTEIEDTRVADEAGVPDAVVDVPEQENLAPLDIVDQDISPEEWDKLYGGECKLAERVGLVEVFRADWGQMVQARFKDKVAATEVFEEVAVEGGCRLLNRAAPECTPSCNQQTEQCSLAESCEPLPALLDVGTVTVSGLSFAAALSPNANNDYGKFDFPQEPLFVDGALIEVSIPEGPLGPFQMQGRGVAGIVMVEPPVTISKGAGFDLAWEESGGSGEVFIQVSLENHATTPLTIQCTVPDTGGITISQDFIDQLLAAWVAGTVVATVQRRTVDAESFKSGCIEFQVYSDWDKDLEVK